MSNIRPVHVPYELEIEFESQKDSDDATSEDEFYEPKFTDRIQQEKNANLEVLQHDIAESNSGLNKYSQPVTSSSHLPYSTADENTQVITQAASIHHSKMNIQLRRNRGLEYINIRGKLVAARKYEPLTACRKHCMHKLTFQEQEQLFKEYWSLGNYRKRVSYMSRLISQASGKKRLRKNSCSTKRANNNIYHIIKSGIMIEVCKMCFKKTFGETDKFLSSVLRKSLSGNFLPHE